MISVLVSLLQTLRGLAQSRAALHLEGLALRHQLQVLQRTRPRRVRLATADRWLSGVAVPRVDRVANGAGDRQAGDGDRVAPLRVRLVWTCKSRRRTGRPAVPPDVQALIRTMSRANPLWGAPRIHGELLKLGIAVSQATVAKYVGRDRQPPSQTWRTFWRITSDTWWPPISSSSRRRHAVCCSSWCSSRTSADASCTSPSPDHPTAAWTAQQLREAFPWDQAPRYLLRDRDHAFDGWAETAKTTGIDELLTAPRSPWQNPFAERAIGSLRLECLDHVIVWSERSLRRHLGPYLTDYHAWRTHLSLDTDAPVPRPVQSPTCGAVGQVPHRGGLHHLYERRAA
jgi:hypothetical protein